MDVSVVNDDFFVLRGEDGAGYWHILDGKSLVWGGVLLADLYKQSSTLPSGRLAA